MDQIEFCNYDVIRIRFMRVRVGFRLAKVYMVVTTNYGLQDEFCRTSSSLTAFLLAGWNLFPSVKNVTCNGRQYNEYCEHHTCATRSMRNVCILWFLSVRVYQHMRNMLNESENINGRMQCAVCVCMCV